MTRIKLTVSDQLLALIDQQATARAKTRSEFVRDATIAYMTKYPAKGYVADILAPNRIDPKVLGSDGNLQQTTCKD